MNSNNSNKLDRTEILRRVIADAESMGFRNREKIEKLTNQVIERLERPRTLPGMEYMAAKSYKPAKFIPTSDEITAIVKEILNNEIPVKREEDRPEMKKTTPVETGPDMKQVINLSDFYRCNHLAQIKAENGDWYQ